MGGPPSTQSVPVSAGQHRVTLYSGDSPDEQFRFVVYLDGQVVIEKTMGRNWMPEVGRWQAPSTRGVLSRLILLR